MSTASRPVALVTGAARRLGRAIALDLAAHGFDVAVHYRSSEADAHATVGELRALGAQAQAFRADLSDEAACRTLVPAVAAHFERLDAIVNSASTFEYDAPATFSVASMEKHWRANTAPACLLAQALHAHLAEGSHERPSSAGCVVNLIDQKLWNPNPDYFSYTLSKAALQAATVMLAQALAPRVRVCGVAPGVTMVSGPMNADEFAAAHKMTPLERSSTPEDIARAVRFLIESPAITGTTLLVDGGQHLVAQPRDVLYLAQKNLENSPHAQPASHPSLMDCRRLFLRDYEVMINIGVHAFEKTGEQRVLINVDLYIPLALSTPKADELDEVVDYDFMRRSIGERVGQGHIHLQETLCDDVLQRMLAHPKVRAARVSTEKPMFIPTAMRSDARCSA